MRLIKEFKDFAMKGNIFDLAIAVIIGGAFGKIVSSLVSDVIMPPIGAMLGGVNFTDIKIGLGNSVAINIGNFIQSVVDFLIIAFVIFIMVKIANKVKKQEIAPEEIVKVSKEEILLTEIRDLLKLK